MITIEISYTNMTTLYDVTPRTQGVSMKLLETCMFSYAVYKLPSSLINKTMF